MVCVPKWELLGEALARLIGSGVRENDAKRDLCNAVADGTIKVRVRGRSEPEWMVHEDIFVPPRL